MGLRGKKPESVTKRLKLLMFGPSGVGKTTAAIQFPQCYVIDCERGTEQKGYVDLVNASGGAVFQTTDINDVVQEVKSLLTERHEYRTLVIDPLTTVYNDLLQKAEDKVGTDHGKHYGEADKQMKRLANLLMTLDMNIVMTAHAKVEYGANFSKLGNTFEGWKRADYFFDLVLQLGRSRNFDVAQTKAKSTQRWARVEKTRLSEFPDMDVFEWSYDAVKARYDPGVLERESAVVALVTAEQLRELKEVLKQVKLPEGTTDRWKAKAGVDLWEDMPAEIVSKCIEYAKARLPAPGEGRRVVMEDVA